MKLLLFLYVLIFEVIGSEAVFSPRVVITPETNPVQKPAGAQIPLLCKVDDVPDTIRPGIIWVKHDGLDKTGNVEVKSLDHHTMSLLIKNATSEDSGVYTCQAQIGGHLLSKTVDVIIFENFDFADKRTDIGYVTPSAAVNLSCEVTPSSVKVRTVWTRGGVPIAQGAGDKYKLYNNDAILEVSSYDPTKDAGEYVCKVSSYILTP
ncbi:immunoglobulin domain protein [Oesophagostomum dentatum]|uniref:Immunoglobulin domain protein n=1 Tax=Oesophagostomum dentatum TaxID=61180 RepID=A0A0B1TWM3_OESDE|nr:immunoglobulin domain protein [Oesophagostomum dentatum]